MTHTLQDRRVFIEWCAWHMDWRLSNDQRSPPSSTGTTWSTSVANVSLPSLSQWAHMGWRWSCNRLVFCHLAEL